MNNLSRNIIVVGVAVALLFFTVTGTSQVKSQKPILKRGTVTLSYDAQVGKIPLKKGTYDVYCDHSKPPHHEMVFTRLSDRFNAPTKDVTRIPCEMEDLGTKNVHSEAHLVPIDPDTFELKEIQIKGETAKHVFVDR